MELNCNNEYNKFKQYFTLSHHINDIYNLIKLKLQDVNYQIYGEQNLMKIFHINSIVEIAENCKNNQKLCEVLSLLYTNDFDVYCKTEKDMITFIKGLGNIFHDNVLDSIQDNGNIKTFKGLFKDISL